jgi:hypothetical protein
MLELIVERWTGRDGNTDFLWSLWHDGRRVRMGGPHLDAGDCEKEALQACETELGMKPDRITRL